MLNFWEIGIVSPYSWAGGLHDHDLGFVRFGWRDYDTFTSRWTASDPIGDGGGDPDWYGYCLDDPVNGVDALGLKGKKGAFGRIAKSGLIGMGTGAYSGAVAGAPMLGVGSVAGAVAGAAIGLPVGLLKGTIKEYPPLREKLDKTKDTIIHELTDGRAERMKKNKRGYSYSPKK